MSHPTGIDDRHIDVHASIHPIDGRTPPPDRDLPMLLWLTRGPSFGLIGPKELGVPPEVFG